MNRISSLRAQAEQEEPAKQTCSECLSLETDAQGRIPIATDWLTILSILENIENFYLQTRHAYGRLISKKAPTGLAWLEEGLFATDKAGSILLYPNNTYNVWGYVGHCNCCGSPGRIDFCNEYGLDMMQICCPANIEAIKWGRLIAQCSSAQPRTPTLARTERIPIIPGNAKRLEVEPRAVTTLIDWIANNEASFIATLISTGIIQRREIKPVYVDWNEHLLRTTDKEVTLQLGLPAVRSIFIVDHLDAPRFFIAGPDNVQLLAIEPPENPERREAFLEAVSSFLSNSV